MLETPPLCAHACQQASSDRNTPLLSPDLYSLWVFHDCQISGSPYRDSSPTSTARKSAFGSIVNQSLQEHRFASSSLEVPPDTDSSWTSERSPFSVTSFDFGGPSIGIQTWQRPLEVTRPLPALYAETQLQSAAKSPKACINPALLTSSPALSAKVSQACDSSSGLSSNDHTPGDPTRSSPNMALKSGTKSGSESGNGVDCESDSESKPVSVVEQFIRPPLEKVTQGYVHGKRSKRFREQRMRFAKAWSVSKCR